jgi:hypothetical protein
MHFHTCSPLYRGTTVVKQYVNYFSLLLLTAKVIKTLHTIYVSRDYQRKLLTAQKNAEALFHISFQRMKKKFLLDSVKRLPLLIREADVCTAAGN